MTLLIQSVLACLLFTGLLFVQAFKGDPVQSLYNFPPKIQERVKSLEEYKGRIPAENKKVSAKVTASVVIIGVGVLLCKLADTQGFKETVTHMFILYSVVNIYDLIVIDWLLFPNVKKIRILGTEDMEKEYRNYLFHFIAFIRGTVFGLIISLGVGIIYVLI